MRRLFLIFLFLMPMCAMASENLIENLHALANVTITDGVVSQIQADTRNNCTWKLQFIYNNRKHPTFNSNQSYEQVLTYTNSNIGFISHTFTAPADLEDLAYIRMGLNGAVYDSVIAFDFKDVKPNTTYTLQWRVLNTTQGEIAWTDMCIVHCGDGYSLTLGEENCSRACENQTVAGGHIPPDKTTVYEPEICTYDIVRLNCDDGYARIDNACEQMCTAGIAYLHIGNVVYGLYARKNSTPALHIGYNDNVCYGHLAPGAGSGLNINIDGTVYHLID